MFYAVVDTNYNVRDKKKLPETNPPLSSEEWSTKLRERLLDVDSVVFVEEYDGRYSSHHDSRYVENINGRGVLVLVGEPDLSDESSLDLSFIRGMADAIATSRNAQFKE